MGMCWYYKPEQPKEAPKAPVVETPVADDAKAEAPAKKKPVKKSK